MTKVRGNHKTLQENLSQTCQYVLLCNARCCFHTSWQKSVFKRASKSAKHIDCTGDKNTGKLLLVLRLSSSAHLRTSHSPADGNCLISPDQFKPQTSSSHASTAVKSVNSVFEASMSGMPYSSCLAFLINSCGIHKLPATVRSIQLS